MKTIQSKTENERAFDKIAQKHKKQARRRKHQQIAIFYKKRHNIVKSKSHKSAAQGGTISRMLRGLHYDV